MGQTIFCDNHDGIAAVVLLTHLQNGDSYAMCGECWPQFVRDVATATEATQGHEEAAEGSEYPHEPEGAETAVSEPAAAPDEGASDDDEGAGFSEEEAEDAEEDALPEAEATSD